MSNSNAKKKKAKKWRKKIMMLILGVWVCIPLSL